jgi:hypothetical protein
LALIGSELGLESTRKGFWAGWNGPILVVPDDGRVI